MPTAFILLEQDDLIVKSLTHYLNPNSWYEAGEYKKGLTSQLLPLNIQRLHFQGSQVHAKVCAICVDYIVYYQRAGIWRDQNFGLIFTFLTHFNGTLEVEGVFALLQDEANEDGEWDGFLQSTIYGLAVFTHNSRILISVPLFCSQ